MGLARGGMWNVEWGWNGWAAWGRIRTNDRPTWPLGLQLAACRPRRPRDPGSGLWGQGSESGSGSEGLGLGLLGPLGLGYMGYSVLVLGLGSDP
jgi:hypothetical protein